MLGPVSGLISRGLRASEDAAAGIAALVRSGALRRMSPRTIGELGRRLVREGATPHVLYVLHALEQPSRPALIFEGRRITWAELRERLDRLTNHIISCGVSPGDGVAIMLPNRPEFMEAEVAALRAGALVSFVNPKAPAPDAHGLFERTNTKLVVTHRPDVTPEGLQVLEAGEPYEKALAAASPDEPSMSKDVHGKVVIFTSGTTGRPKGAVRDLSGGSTLGTLAGFLRIIPFRRDDTHMVVCPMYHSSGSGFASVAHALGNPLVLVERFSPETFCRTVSSERVTTTAVVPTMLHKLCDWPGARDFDLSSLRVVVCTGSPLREEVRVRARELLGDVIYDLYGSTEMGWVSVASPEDQRRAPGTVGRPVPGVRVRILDPQGHELPPGEPGEVWTTSDLMMESYLDDPELNAERMRDGYVSVRDVGFIDGSGYLHVIDRADDMIISGGVNVYPAETEVALGSHPSVSEVAVVGVDDPGWGQRIVAAVVASHDVAPDDLVAWCKEHVGYAAVPKEIKFMDELPRNDIGKVDKRRLVSEWS
jgi:fatty-acyl-CoA synthase